MAKPADRISELVSAAERIDADLRRLEDASNSVRKIKLHSEKSILRAARELQEALSQQERLADGLRALGEAMLRMQARQQGAMEPLLEHAQVIQKRTELLGAFMQRFASLGTQAAELSQALKNVWNPEENANEPAKPDELTDCDARLGGLIDAAKSLAEEAQEEELTEVAREADALRQKMQAARGRLGAFFGNSSQAN